MGQNGRDTEGIMLGAGGLQLLGWVGVSMSGVGWVQEMGIGGFALKVVLSDRDTTCWFGQGWGGFKSKYVSFSSI